MKTAQLEKVRGFIKNILKDVPCSNGQVRRSFVLIKADDDTEVFCNTFGKFDRSLVGKDVEFDAEYNTQYKNYTVRGDIREISDAGSNQPRNEAVAADPKPQPKARAKKAETQSVTEAPTSSGREAHRAEAEESLVLNLQSAKKIATQLGYENPTLTDLVSVSDILGRTITAIFMDAKKDERMNSIRG